MNKWTVLSGILGLGVVGVGCGGGTLPGGSREAGHPAPAAAACARRAPGVGAAPLAAPRTGSSVALARLGDRTLAYVADADAGVVRTVDVGTQAELARTSLSGAPSQLLVARDGRVLVAIRDKAMVQVLEPTADPAAPLEARCSVATPEEPVALAVTPDDGTVLVTSGWGAALSAYAADAMTPAFRVPLAREPRAVLVSDDGKKAFVAHVVGSRMSVVDLASPAHPVRNIELRGTEKGFRRRGLVGSLLGGGSDEEIDRKACQGFALAKTAEPAGRVLAPQVLVDPGDTLEPSGGYGSGGMNPVEVADVAVVDDVTEKPLPMSLAVEQDVRMFGGSRARGPACLLPRAAAVDAESHVLLVACMGIDSVMEYDALAADPQSAVLRRWSVGSGPSGIAVDTQARRAVVWSQFDRTLAVIPLLGRETVTATQAVAKFELPRAPSSERAEELALGRKLFHTTVDPRISNDGRACASCHPDGRDDSLTWATPDGPRQTPMLAGRIASTAPYGWNGAGKDVKEHLGHTFQRLGGSGLSDKELDALISFTGKMQAPAAMKPSAPAEQVARGSEIFHSGTAGCASCHEGGGMTDHVAHDVGSKAKADAAPKFDTPSLRFVGGTAPYFHDGRYATLRALLVDTSGEMGHTKQLSPADLVALEAYLRSL